MLGLQDIYFRHLRFIEVSSFLGLRRVLLVSSSVVPRFTSAMILRCFVAIIDDTPTHTICHESNGASRIVS